MIIVSVEESALLLAVDAVVGGVEVEDQVLGRVEMRGDELIDQDLGDLDQGLAVDAVLQPAEGRRRGEGRRRRRAPCRRRFAGRDRRGGSDGR